MQQLSLLPNAPANEGWVYYATDGYHIKIGHTCRNVQRRGGELSANIVYSFPGSELIERQHHYWWRRYRLNGSEWFNPGDELLLWLFVQLIGHGHTPSLRLIADIIISTKKQQRAAA